MSYRPLTSEKKKNTEHITALLNAGSTVDELIVVLEWKAANDKGNEVARRYFDCVTPFRPKHWENNIALATDWDAKGRPASKPSGNGTGGVEANVGIRRGANYYENARKRGSNVQHFADEDEAGKKLAANMKGGSK